MPKLLTAAAIQKLRPDRTKAREVRDGGAPGLRLAIQPSGYKSWIIRGRIRADGRQGKVTLGPLDLSGTDEGEPTLGAPLSLRAARVLANQLLRQRARGVDIAEAKLKLISKSDAFPAVVEEFIRDHARPRNRGWRETARVLGLIYPDDLGEPALIPGGLARRWAAKPIAAIDQAAIHAVIAEARRGSESRGRALAAALGKLFAWATQHRHVAVNPALGMFRPRPPEARARVLADAELADVWRASEKIGFPFGPVVKLLLLSGQRRREISAMRWSELSDDFATLSLPPARTKNKRPHAVPLPPLAREIIAALPRRAGTDLVFTTTGATPISGFSKFKAQLDELIETTEPWRIHDLRRTAVTGMAELGVLPHVVEAAVNHVSGHKGGVAGIYNRAVYAAEKKAALERWADHVAAIVGRP